MTVRVVTTDDTYELPGEMLPPLDARYAGPVGNTDAAYNLAMGTGATTAGGYYALAVGSTARASKTFAVAVGGNSTADGDRSTVIGASATAIAANSIAIGQNAAATAAGSVAIGRDSAGTAVVADVQDEMKLGTPLTTVHAGKDLKTLQPSGNGNPAWQLGAVVTAAATVDATRYVEVMIGGALVKLVVAE